MTYCYFSQYYSKIFFCKNCNKDLVIKINFHINWKFRTEYILFFKNHLQRCLIITVSILKYSKGISTN